MIPGLARPCMAKGKDQEKRCKREHSQDVMWCVSTVQQVNDQQPKGGLDIDITEAGTS